MVMWRSCDGVYLSHVDEAQGEGLVPQDGAVLVALPTLQHDLELVGISL